MPKKKATKKKDKCEMKWKDKCKDTCSSSGGCTYFLAFLGAAAYNISVTTGFWAGVWGVIKALICPAFLVYKLFQFLA